jgi:hypothetical protein
MIQVALLLDTSSSMEGLIRQAKSSLWAIVNGFAQAEKDGFDPILQLALYEYGRNTLPAEGGHVRKVISLTDDLDRVFDELFALEAIEISGSNEYCGWATDQAIQEFGWSQSNDDLKTVYIAGNETFKLGEVNYQLACQQGMERGITLNTIFCGSYSQGVRFGWKNGAQRADGTYMAIEQNRIVSPLAAPQDSKLKELNSSLNATYLPYGTLGRSRQQAQIQQDVDAYSISGTIVERAATKASKLYNNPKWDLVDAVVLGEVDLKQFKPSDLPENLRNLTIEQRQRYIMDLNQKRTVIRQQIQDLNRERMHYIEAERRKLKTPSDALTLGAAVLESLKSQAREKDFKLK